MKTKHEVPKCPIHEVELRCASCSAAKAAKAMHKRHGNRVGFSKPGFQRKFGSRQTGVTKAAKGGRARQQSHR